MPLLRRATGAPSRTPIEGQWCRLEPLRLEHAPDLYRAAAPERFTWLFDAMPRDEAEMVAWVEKAMATSDPLFFAVIDRTTGRAEGRQAFMRIVPEHGVIEIGNIYWGDAIARSRVATEALYLFARHAFEALGYRRFEWKCNDRNEPSKKAARRFGFTYEGTFRQHMIFKGENRDTAWFAMLDQDWHRVREAFETWLKDDNFDAQGQQKAKLRID